MKKAFTLVELLTVMAVLAILIAVLLPVLSNAKRSGHKATCQSNLSTVGRAVQLYVDDYDGAWPDTEVWHSWNRADNGFPKSARGTAPRLAGCPQAVVPPDREEEMKGRGYIVGYATNTNIGSTTDTKIVYPATTVAFFDAGIDGISASSPDPYENAYPYPYNAERGFERHNGGGNYLFCDGHVGWFEEPGISDSEPDICGGDKRLPHFCTK